MKKTLDKGDFRDLFKAKVIVVAGLPPGKARALANTVQESSGRGDATLRTKADFHALFNLLDAESSGTLTLEDDAGIPTAIGELVAIYLKAAKDRTSFFNDPMYMVVIEDWPPEHLTPEEPVYSNGGSILSFWATEPDSPQGFPPAGDQGVLLTTRNFSLKNSGNRTLRAPKRSWKVNFETNAANDKVFGMWRFNLKAMYNDPSQMREALAWHIFNQIGVPSSRHCFAKLAINGQYRGLFSLIEQVDESFLNAYFGKNDNGNLYKAYCGNVGCATLEFRPAPASGDTGWPYYEDHANSDLTYRLKSNEDDPESNNYSDLALLIHTLNGMALPGGEERFSSDTYRESMEGILNVKAFLRWASANLLLGGWDNYYATPSNYYLYNSGRKGAPKGFMQAPYFTWIPWDYDNSFGIDYFNTQWQHTDIIDWVSNTRNYNHGNGTSHIPLVQNLLKHPDFIQYYLDHLEHLLDTLFNPETIGPLMGAEGEGGLWDQVRQAAYLESDTPAGQPFTGRQFSNHEVYLNGLRQWELISSSYKVEGIIHYVRMRHDSARQQLQELRRHFPRSTGGADFTGVMEPLPEVAEV